MNDDPKRIDAVFTPNRFMVYQGTPDAVKAWIGANNPNKLNKYYLVQLGGSNGEMISIAQYLGWDEIVEDIVE